MTAIIPWIGLILRCYIGGYFIIAALPKIIEPLAFATSIAHYGILPNWAVNASALVLPWIEMISGILLIVGYKVRLNALFTGAMLVIFTSAVAYAVVQGLKIDCGCFGSQGGDEVSWWKVGKNSLMILTCLVLWKWPSTALSVETGVTPDGSKPA